MNNTGKLFVGLFLCLTVCIFILCFDMKYGDKQYPYPRVTKEDCFQMFMDNKQLFDEIGSLLYDNIDFFRYVKSNYSSNGFTYAAPVHITKTDAYVNFFSESEWEALCDFYNRYSVATIQEEDLFNLPSHNEVPSIVFTFRIVTDENESEFVGYRLYYVGKNYKMDEETNQLFTRYGMYQTGGPLSQQLNRVNDSWYERPIHR